jgi:hypothetical protein
VAAEQQTQTRSPIGIMNFLMVFSHLESEKSIEKLNPSGQKYTAPLATAA